MRSKVCYGCLGLALALAAAAGLKADGGFGVRLAGGYGFGQNSLSGGVQIGTLGSESAGQSLSLSEGMPTQAEVLYGVLPRIQIGLGVFPVFGVSQSVNLESAPLEGTIGNFNSYPVLLSAYFSQPLGRGFGAFAGFGVGVVPAGSFDFSIVGYGTTETATERLDAGFAARGALGADYAFDEHIKLGLQIQELVFDRAVISQSQEGESFGRSGGTYDYNQFAPEIFAEGDF